MSVTPRVLHRLGPALALVVSLALAFGAVAKKKEDTGEVNNPKKAVKKYQKAVQKAPNDPDSWYNLGVAYILLERWEEAVEATGRAVELNPASARAQFRAGEALKGAGRIEEALPFFQKAAELDPTMIAAHVNAGDAFSDLGRYEEAIAAYKAALKNKPENPAPYYNNLGDAYVKLGEVEKGLRWFEKTVELAPDNPDTHYNLGVIYRKLGQQDGSFFAKAAASLLRAAELAPDDPQIQLLAAETLFWVERNEDGKARLQRYFALDPDGTRVSEAMRQVALELKQLFLS